jgi:3-oxoacyl-[acyl-carrier protein] reductase
MNTIDLRGRRAVVTGGASGIGLAIARRILDSGATVRLWDRNDAALEAALRTLDSPDADGDIVDVTQWNMVEAAAARAIRILGGVQILVNSAGIAGSTVAPTWDYPVDEWARVVDANLHGTFHACKALVPALRASGWGRIANIASVAGKEGNPQAAAYAASKGAVIAFTKALGKELATSGVLVNCVTPAVIDTPMVQGAPVDFLDFLKAKIPMGRLGRPEEVAAMVAWMCSDDCSFTTGGVFDLSGGRSTY